MRLLPSFRMDGHFDLLMSLEKRRAKGLKNVVENQFLPGFLAGGFQAILATIFIENKFLPEMGLRKGLDQVSSLYEDQKESTGKWSLCKTYEDLENCINQQKFSVLLSMEGAEPLMNDLLLLTAFYELGVRFLGLVWSRRNYVADGSHFTPVLEGKKGGLTDFGVELLKKAESLGIIIDVSHLNDEGFEDVCRLATRPFIASHSNCRSLLDIARNITDHQIKKIAESGGLIGINAAKVFLNPCANQASIKDYVHHIDHVKRLVGIDNVCLGFDFCMHLREDEPVSVPSSLSDTLEFKEILQGHKEMPLLLEAFQEAGYSSSEIEKISGSNFMRFIRKNLSNPF